MEDFRRYGPTPADVVILHGGPGGAGEVEPFARELGRRGYAVLEPFQTGCSIEDQVEELRLQISQNCKTPVVLVGWSWGAWLGTIFAAQHPALVRLLILVGSGPFEDSYRSVIKDTKASRLSEDERVELEELRPFDGNPSEAQRFIELSDVADTYLRDTSPQPNVILSAEIHSKVWSEASSLRTRGVLSKIVSDIQCPVVAIHGDYDPRPADGVCKPLLLALPSARFVLLERCGHKPWQEVHAKDRFYQLMEELIDDRPSVVSGQEGSRD